jgi:glycosyltransferase involved in cell wall biosynthesis
MKTFGLIVPFYCNLEYFSELIDSIKRQSSNSYEVLIVDDSGKRVIQRIVEEEIKDDRFTFIENDVNQGPFASWNAGLVEMADRQKYSLLSIVHADDVLDFDYVKNAIKALNENPEVDIFHSKVKIIGSNGGRKFSFQDSVKSLANVGTIGKPIKSFGDKGLVRILRNNFVFCPTMIFNVSKFDSIEFDTRWKMVGDLEFISQALLEGRSLLRL